MKTWLSRKRRSVERRLRVEQFGAIAQLSWPRALVFVDRDYARTLGIKTSSQWSGEEPDIGERPLVAPLEAHLQITNRCDAGCQGCYTAAAPSAQREWPIERWKASIDALADMGVFHLALGGGESADLPWLGELVQYARDRGLVPNLTTSGLSNLSRVLQLAPLFGQINISIDGLDDEYARVRGFDGFAEADAALIELRKRTRNVGINVVVTRHNFGSLGAIFAYAKKRRLNEVELLRFKPAGRGISTFADMSCSDVQHREFLPTVLKGARRHRLRVRVDCSYMPMLVHHKPSRELLASLSVYGCTGGDFLIGAKATGQATACSFAQPPVNGPNVDALADYWKEPSAFGAFRDWKNAEEPCKSCDYHSLCRGGCRVVSRHLVDDERKPDPECPRVVDANAKHKTLPLR
ncbi:MAG: radical SAM protein [Myxococcales bacterium]|nr:radical SAM protein [Myxococcales bacterium]